MTIFARVNAADGALMEHNVEEIAHSVCDGDPRSADQRRAQALVAAVNHTAFDCGCDDPDCPAGTAGDAPAKNAVVYAIADTDTINTTQQGAHPDDPEPEPDNEAEPDTEPEPEPDADTDTDGDGDGDGDTEGDAKARHVESGTEPATPADSADTGAPRGPARCAAPPAYVFGAGIMPTALLGGLLERATIREVRHPGADSPPEPRHVPSRKLAEFVRCRDLTCRYPGCDKPAQVCDIDHTVPYPVGPTHPSNLKCLCRFHHLLKTFWVGRNGWSDKQLPDGTVIWTLPTGHQKITHPDSLYLFPQLCAPTATLWTGDPPVVEDSGNRGVMMPKRRRTRAQNTAKAKAAERKLNDALVAEHNRPPPF